MTAPLVHIALRVPVDLKFFEKDEPVKGTRVAQSRDTYRKGGHDDGTFGGTLWEREAERATLTE